MYLLAAVAGRIHVPLIRPLSQYKSLGAPDVFSCVGCAHGKGDRTIPVCRGPP